MSKHYFHETEQSHLYSEFYRLIYCEWCGIVVWNFNANDRTDPSTQELQANAGTECKANLVEPKSTEKTDG